MKTEYIHSAKWYEIDTQKCKNCGSPISIRIFIQTIFASKNKLQEPKEYWVCNICGSEVKK